MTAPEDPRAAFIRAAFWHGSVSRANAILDAHPGLASSDIHVAAMLGDAAAVRRFLAIDPSSATARSGPFDVDALTHLCFSAYLAEDRSRSEAFVDAATALVDAGASPDTGFWEPDHQPEPEWEPALYGAAGVAHHAPVTRLLLERGATPDLVEVVYHTPETHDNAAMRQIVETGRLSEDSLALMLVRKHDWHDYEGVRYLLQKGIDLNRRRSRGWQPLHHAIARDNDLAIIELLFDHGADPSVMNDGQSAAALAARRGRGDVLRAIDRRGLAVELTGVERLVAGCARADEAEVRDLAAREPDLVERLRDEGSSRLAEFAGNGHLPGVGLLLDLGIPVDALYKGDGYFGIAPGSTALHVAAWRGHPPVVAELIARGAAVDAQDSRGRTPLALAVLATVESYWTEWRSPDSVAALLRAGASLDGVRFPCGYDAVDELLRRAGAG